MMTCSSNLRSKRSSPFEGTPHANSLRPREPEPDRGEGQVKLCSFHIELIYIYTISYTYDVLFFFMLALHMRLNFVNITYSVTNKRTKSCFKPNGFAGFD